MKTQIKCQRHRGFVLIEALVALLVVAFAALGISKISSVVMSSAGDSRARAEASLIAESALEQLRNHVIQTQFTANFANGSTSIAPRTIAGGTATFSVTSTVTTIDTLQRGINVAVAWSSNTGQAQSVNLSSRVVWDNSDTQPSVSSGGGGIPVNSTITPRGDAKRVNLPKYQVGSIPGTSTGINDYKVYDNGGTSELIDSTGRVVIEAKGGFAAIIGRVYFFRTSGPAQEPNDFMVRLSSEGECIFNTGQNPTPITKDGKTYDYFDYRCYVGRGWYGNVAVVPLNSNQNFSTCVGDPGLPAANAANSLVAPQAQRSNSRSYRGFEYDGVDYLSTGMSPNSVYPNVNTGKPKPSDYAHYGINSGTSEFNFFANDFLINPGNTGCNSTSMSTTLFARNAGPYYCISPDNSISDDACPAVWPNFTAPTGDAGGGGGGDPAPSCTINMLGGGAYTGEKAKVSWEASNNNKGTCKIVGGGDFTCSALVVANGTAVTFISAQKDLTDKVLVANANCSQSNQDVGNFP